MYAELAYNADALNTPTQVLAHITQLLTGETVVGNLTGGNLDAANSSIDTSFEAISYILHDDISATDKVFKIAAHDDPTSFFYFELLVSSNDIDMKLWEDWNATTHAGTGGTYYTSSGFEFVSMISYSTSAFTLYFTASASHCLARSLYSSGTIKYCRGFMQYTRGEFWDTVAAGKKPVVLTYADSLFTTTTHAYALPHKRSDGATYSGSSAKLYAATRYGLCQLDSFTNLLGNNSSAARGLDASGNSIHNMYEFGFGFVSTGERFLSAKVPNMYIATYGNGAFGDTVAVAGATHIIWEASTQYRMAIRKG